MHNFKGHQTDENNKSALLFFGIYDDDDNLPSLYRIHKLVQKSL